MSEDKQTDRMLGRKLGEFRASPSKLTFGDVHKNYVKAKKLSFKTKIALNTVIGTVATASIVAGFFLVKNAGTHSATATHYQQHTTAATADSAAAKSAHYTDTIKSIEERNANTDRSTPHEPSVNTNAGSTEQNKTQTAPAAASSLSEKTGQPSADPAHLRLTEPALAARAAHTGAEEKHTGHIQKNNTAQELADQARAATAAAFAAKRVDSQKSGAPKPDQVATKPGPSSQKLLASATRSKQRNSPGAKTAKINPVASTAEQNVAEKAETNLHSAIKNTTTKNRTRTNQKSQTGNAGAADGSQLAKQAVQEDKPFHEENKTKQANTKTDAEQRTADTRQAADKIVNPSDAANAKTQQPADQQHNADNKVPLNDKDEDASQQGNTTENAATDASTNLAANTANEETETPGNAEQNKPASTEIKTDGAVTNPALQNPELLPAQSRHHFLISTELVWNSLRTQLGPNTKAVAGSYDSLVSQSHSTVSNKLLSGSLLLGYSYKNFGVGTGFGFLSAESQVDTRSLATTKDFYSIKITTRTDSFGTHTDTTRVFAGRKTFVIVNGDTVSPQTYINTLRFVTIPFQFNYAFNLARGKVKLEPQLGIQLGIPLKSYQVVEEKQYEFSYAKSKVPFKNTFLFYDASLRLSFRVGTNAFIYFRQGYYFRSQSLYKNDYLVKYTLSNLYSAFGLTVMLK